MLQSSQQAKVQADQSRDTQVDDAMEQQGSHHAAQVGQDLPSSGSQQPVESEHAVDAFLTRKATARLSQLEVSVESDGSSSASPTSRAGGTSVQTSDMQTSEAQASTATGQDPQLAAALARPSTARVSQLILSLDPDESQEGRQSDTQDGLETVESAIVSGAAVQEQHREMRDEPMMPLEEAAKVDSIDEELRKGFKLLDPERLRRPRRKELPAVARARRSSKEPEMRKAFDEIDLQKTGSLSFSDVHGYLCDYLGFGQLEAAMFFHHHGGTDGGVTFDQFQKGYALLNPFVITDLSEELIIRKPGSMRGVSSPADVKLEKLDDCEVYICDQSAQAFIDFCNRCLIMIGPCDSSVFVRDCEDCIIWVAAKQLRTRACKRCTFFLYANTEPVIEMSEDLTFAPWAAKYPQCRLQFEAAKFDPKRNFWNAIFDFSGKAEKSNWRILPLGEVQELEVQVDEAPGEAAQLENPVPPVTHDMLCAAPLSSGQSCGQGIANIPQTRPRPPERPAAPTIMQKVSAQDSTERKSVCGVQRLRALDRKSGAHVPKQTNAPETLRAAQSAVACFNEDDDLEVIECL
jgi:hypothetical protein